MATVHPTQQPPHHRDVPKKVPPSMLPGSSLHTTHLQSTHPKTDPFHDYKYIAQLSGRFITHLFACPPFPPQSTHSQAKLPYFIAMHLRLLLSLELPPLNTLPTFLAAPYRTTIGTIECLTAHSGITFNLLYTILVPAHARRCRARCTVTGLKHPTRTTLEGMPAYQLGLEGRPRWPPARTDGRGRLHRDGGKWVVLTGVHHMLKCGPSKLSRQHNSSSLPPSPPSCATSPPVLCHVTTVLSAHPTPLCVTVPLCARLPHVLSPPCAPPSGHLPRRRCTVSSASAAHTHRSAPASPPAPMLLHTAATWLPPPGHILTAPCRARVAMPLPFHTGRFPALSSLTRLRVGTSALSCVCPRRGRLSSVHTSAPAPDPFCVRSYHEAVPCPSVLRRPSRPTTACLRRSTLFAPAFASTLFARTPVSLRIHPAAASAPRCRPAHARVGVPLPLRNGIRATYETGPEARSSVSTARGGECGRRVVASGGMRSLRAHVVAAGTPVPLRAHTSLR
ncbi:hypothetical protein DFH08DRAFT_973332 [Mycena albidolilacea]|uniref:Uncharacterized protein n=1 Tax=Mycena albidolilacea TaxID=1033008 RepID=A0AAD6Z9L7_9AGAR|nr:hypothetical protein DFH08DRAFT_973332 [Mycena albidolilacea]